MHILARNCAPAKHNVIKLVAMIISRVSSSTMHPLDNDSIVLYVNRKKVIKGITNDDDEIISDAGIYMKSLSHLNGKSIF